MLVCMSSIFTELTGTEFLESMNSLTILLEVFVMDKYDTKQMWTSLKWNRLHTANVAVLGSPQLQKHVLKELSAVPNNTDRLSWPMLDMCWLFWLDNLLMHDVAVMSLHVHNLAAVTLNDKNELRLHTLQWTSKGRQFVDVTGDIIGGDAMSSLFPNVNNGLNGMALRVGVVEWYSSLIVETRNNHTEFSGFCVDIMDILSHHLNFSYTMHVPDDGQFGDLVDGQWTGVLGMLQRKEIDLALPLAPRLKRRAVGDWTDSLYYSSITVVYKMDASLSNTLISFLHPFHWKIYVCVLGCFTFCVAGVYMYSAFTHRPQPSLPLFALFVEVVERMFVSMLNKPIPGDIRQIPMKALFVSWCLFGLVMTSAYTSKLTSLLVDTTPTPPFTSLPEMVAQDVYKWGLVGASNHFLDFKESNRSVSQAVYHGLLAFAQSDPEVLEASLNVHKRKLLTEPYAFIGDGIGIGTWTAEVCDLFVFPNPDLSVDSNVIYTPKNSSLTHRLNNVIQWLHNSGVLLHTQKHWFQLDERCHSTLSSSTAISLAILQGPLVLALGGLVFGILVLVLECLYCCRERTRCVLPLKRGQAM